MASMPASTVEQLLDGPALHPPPGVTPTLTAHSHQQLWFFVCVSLCVSFCGIFVLLRFYLKLFVTKKLDMSDWFLLLGFTLFIAMVVSGRITVDYGAGVHQWNVKLKAFFKFLYWINLFQILYAPCCFCVKTSIVLQYLRMFAPIRSLNMFMFVGGWLTIVLNLMFYLARMFVAIFSCTPREKIWNKLLPGGHCISNDEFSVITGYFNLVSDLIILLLPVTSLWRLQIPRQKKVGISLLFASGLLANIGTAMRIPYGLRAMSTHDITYHMGWDGLWAYAEMALGIIVAASLSLPKLMKEKGIKFPALPGAQRLFSSLFTSKTSDSSTARTGTRIDSADLGPNSNFRSLDADMSNVIVLKQTWPESVHAEMV